MNPKLSSQLNFAKVLKLSSLSLALGAMSSMSFAADSDEIAQLRAEIQELCNGQVKSDTGIEIWSAFCSKVFGDKYPKVECNRI